MPKKYKKWNKTDDILVSMVYNNVEYSYIAKLLQRKVKSLYERYSVLKNKRKLKNRMDILYSKKRLIEIAKFYKNNGYNKTNEKYGLHAITMLKRHGMYKRNQKPVKKYIDRFLNSGDKYYWAGFIAADGNVSKSTSNTPNQILICLASKDKNHLSKLYKLIGGTIGTNKKGQEFWRIHSREIKDFLVSLNITPAKSLTLEPPSLVIEDDIRDFIRGCFDGDGAIYVNRGRYDTLTTSYSGTSSMLRWINDSLIRYSKITRYAKLRAHKGIYELVFASKRDVKLIMDWMYNCDKVKLRRKHKMYRDHQHLLKYKIKSKNNI